MLECGMSSIMRQEIREYLRASAKLFGLAYQENALTEAEREAIVSYAQELAKRFSQQDGQPLTATSNPIAHLHQAVVLPALTQDP